MKGNRWMLSFGLLILMSAGVFGCGQEEGTGTTDEIEGTYLCYVNTEEDSLARESYEIQGETADEEVEDVLEEMQKEADSIDYRSAFPDHVSVTDWSLTDGRLDLTFSDSYLRMSKGEEVLLRAALVETLGQIKGVDEVGFFTGEGPLTDSDGQEIGYMSPEDFVQNTGSTLHSYQLQELKLYFAGEKGDCLEPETVSLRYNSSTSIEKLVVEQLIKGPEKEGMLAVIPPETRVLGVSVREHICYVNFDQEFLNGTPGVTPEATVYAIVNSLTESGNVSQVQISVNGESDIQYMNRIDLGKPLTRNPDLVEE